MANVTIISVGTLKEDYLVRALDEYKKRLSAYARVDEINIKEERVVNEDDAAQIRRALECEGDKILCAMPQGAVKIALCVEGKQYDSPALAQLIGSAVDRCGKAVFIIGSSHGLSQKVKDACDVRLSISKLTFPHQLMRVILSEAIYRAFTIIHGKKYHK